jgi:hypothetical protein
VTKRERVEHARMQQRLRELEAERAELTQVLGALLDGVDEIAWCLERREPVGTEVLWEMVDAAQTYREQQAEGGPGEGTR